MIIQHAMIHDGLGRPPYMGSLLISNGRIQEISGGDLICPGEELLNAEGCHLYPGFLDPCTPLGSQNFTFRQRDSDEACAPLTPLADVYYALNPDELAMEVMPSVGVTSIGASPGSMNVLGGSMAAFHTVGKNPQAMLLKRDAAMRGALGNTVKEVYGERKQKPMTRMGIFSLLRSFFESEKENAREEQVRERLLSGKLPLFLFASDYQDMTSAIRFFEDYPGIRLVLLGAFAYAEVLSDLIERRIPIIFFDQIHLSHASYADLDLAAVQQLLDADIPVGFSCSTPYAVKGRVHYAWNAARFLEDGLESETVLKLMTSCPAHLLGIEKEVGSIEKGKSADLVLCSGDYLKSYEAGIVRTLIAGKTVYRNEKALLWKRGHNAH